MASNASDSATVLADYPHRMGGHCGSGALRDLMHFHNLGWDGPLSEGLVFTLGGALDFTYLRSSTLTPPVYLVGRGGDLELDLIRRLGGQADLRATDDPTEAWQHVRDEINAGRPVLAWADISELPYLRVRLRMSRHDIVVIGYDDNQQQAHVVDNDRAETQLVPYAALARARSSTGFPEPTRHTTYDITWPDSLPDLHAVAADAFAGSAQRMRTPGRSAIAGPNIDPAMTGLQAVQDFAADLAQWPAHFDHTGLDIALRSLTAFIEKAGTGGGLFRRLLAEGCADLEHRLDDATLTNLAAATARAADAWTEIAQLATTESDPLVRHRDVTETAAHLPDLESATVHALEHSAQSLRSR